MGYSVTTSQSNEGYISRLQRKKTSLWSSIITFIGVAQSRSKAELMRHPQTLQRVFLSQSVIRALQNKMVTGPGHRAAVGMLFGQVVSGTQINVCHLEPFFLTQEKSFMFRQGYVRGRWEAALDLAWTLMGLMTLGYLLVYIGQTPSPEQMIGDILDFEALKIELNEFVLLTVAHKEDNSIEVSAFTYDSKVPITGWRTVSIIYE